MSTDTRHSTLLTLAGTASVGILSWTISIILARLLPAAEFSRYATIASCLLIVGAAAGAGIPWLLAREMSDGNHDREARSVGWAAVASTGGAVVATVTVTAVCWSFGAFLAVLAGFTAGVCVLGVAASGLVQGKQMFTRLAAVRFGEVAVRAVLAVAVTVTGFGAAGVIGAHLVASFVLLTVSLVIVGRVPVNLRGATDRHLWSLSGGIVLLQAAVMWMATVDTIVAGLVLGGTAAGYQTTALFARIPGFVAGALSIIAFAEIVTAGNAKAGRAGSWARSYGMIVVPFTVAFATVPDSLVRVVIPGGVNRVVLVSLAVAGAAAGALNMLTTFWQAEGNLRAAALRLVPFTVIYPAVTILAARTGGVRLLAVTAAAVCLTAVGMLAIAARARWSSGVAAGRWGLFTVLVTVAAAPMVVTSGHPVLWVPVAVVSGLAGLWVGVWRRPARFPSTTVDGKLSVLHLAYESPAAPNAGGGARRTHEVNRRLVARGHRVVCLVTAWPGARTHVVDGVEYIPVGVRFLAGRAARLGYFAALPVNLCRHPADLIVEDFGAPFSSLAVPLWTRRPVVGVVQWLFAREKSAEYRLPFHLVERFGVRSHRRLIAMSDDLSDTLRSMNPAARVVTVENGLEPEALNWPAPLSQEDRADEIVFLGRLENGQKGVDLLLDAWAEAAPFCPGTVLAVYGDGPDRDALEQHAARLGLGDRVEFRGWVSSDQRLGVMARARLVVMPSRYETFGMVAAEAAAVGTPVVAFHIPCLRNLVTPDVGVTVPAYDTQAFAEAVVTLLNDPDRLTRLAATAQATVTRLDWDLLTDAQEAEYYAAVREGTPVTDGTVAAQVAGLGRARAARRGRPARLLLVGNYGNGNLGDDAILTSLASLTPEGTELVVVSRNPERLAPLGVRAVPMLSLAAVREFIRCDAVAVGGGGMFGRGMPLLVGLLPFVMLTARILGKDTGLLAVGAYPDAPFPTRVALSVVARTSRHVSARDERTGVFLGAEVVEDPAHQLPADLTAADRHLSGITGPTLVINLKTTGNDTLDNRTVTAFARLAAWWHHHGGTVVNLPTSTRGDYGRAENSDAALGVRVAEIAGTPIIQLPDTLTPSEAAGIVAAADTAVVMRLHAMIFAGTHNTPCVAVCFEDKTRLYAASRHFMTAEADTVTGETLVTLTGATRLTRT